MMNFNRYSFFFILFLLFCSIYSRAGILTPELELIGVHPSCTNKEDGKAAVLAYGGIEPYTYLWNTGDTIDMLEGLEAGTYTVTVTDAMQSTATGTITLENPSIEWQIFANDETCTGSCDATAIITEVSGGMAPYSFEWANLPDTVQDVAEGLCAGNYQLTITDFNGCTALATIDVALSPEGLWIMSSSTDISCNGADDGTAYVGVMTGVPPYNYVWSDSSIPSTNSPEGMGPGQYYVTVTDVNGCTNLDSVIINEPSPIAINLEVNDFTCRSGQSASIQSEVSGGIPPFLYSWAPAGSGPNPEGLNTGIYFLTVTDANNCTAISMAEVTGANPEAGTLLPPQDSLCLKNNNAEMEASPAGDMVVPPGYAVIYLLISQDDLKIQEYSTEPIFSVSVTGIYSIHTFVYNPDEFNPAQLTPGTSTLNNLYNLLIEAGGDICGALDTIGALRIVSECAECINIGDLVWFDFNQDGLQNPGIPGVDGFVVLLTTAGADGLFGTFDDEVIAEETTGSNGKYLFKCVDPGEYVIVFSPQSLKDDYLFTLPKQGVNPALDSDADTITGATAPFLVQTGQTDNLSIDAGVRVKCIELSDGGEIGYNQVVCENIYPDKLVNVETAGIGLAPVEYQWAKWTQSGPPPWNIVWELLPNTNADSYQPPQLTQNTFFTRFARYKGCLEYTAKSNEVLIEVIIFDPDSCGTNIVQASGELVTEENLIQLDWRIPKWEDDIFFMVEKSFAREAFTPLAGPIFPNAPGQLTFSYADKQPKAGPNNYLISMYNQKGKIAQSAVIIFEYPDLQLQLYPNPVKDILYIDSRKWVESGARLIVYNVFGQPVQSAYHPGEGRIQIALEVSQLLNGVYYLEVDFENNERIVHKFIKTD